MDKWVVVRCLAHPCVILLLGYVLLGQKAAAQYEDYDEEHIESSLPNFSGFHVNMEYYKFNDSENATYLVGNGKIELGDRDYINIELIGAHYSRNGHQRFTPGDFSLSYTRNFYAKNFLDTGFQGWSPTIKLILPTGNAAYSGLFGHWILEPAIYHSWLLRNDRFFISTRWRAFLPIIQVDKGSEPPVFIRFEPRFGYENDRFWLSFTLDNRYITNQDEYVLFQRIDGAYKIARNRGLSFFYTQRIYNKVLFEIYAGVGYYHIF